MSSHPNALELAREEAWFKSTYSSDQGGSCIEIADLIPTTLQPEAFTSFVAHMKSARP
ncbi:DUF397 domain-containing protein [Streptomyces sp. NBC_00343]|uniref:DUF397 domain-containing protein n=1 Tax=Streptomyces sp. NBC_00343 TaxID=2975719 RepID=UPI002E287828|nr:DUF397 domain-containing protein [Streptomyces sp. NBC_00343]